MSYVESQLLPGEQVQYRAHLHRVIYFWPGVAAAVAIAVSVIGRDTPAIWVSSLVVLLVAAVVLTRKMLLRRTSEFAVTDKRVIIKVGWVRRRTVETMLGKVEGVGVDQTVAGRIFGYGTLTVTGTGGTQEQFSMIASPLEFRKQVQAQIAASDSRGHGVVLPNDAGPFTPAGELAREERECPFCAERILVRAKVCKHCGRDVSAASIR
jgi:membrane protein YdbS with pleckstrin-like domain